MKRGRKVAFTLSDIACIAPAPRRDDGDDRRPARSTCCSPTRTRFASSPTSADRDSAVAAIQGKVPLLVVTCGADGALAVEGGRRVSVPIARIGAGVVDTTGAGDLFAAGFLVGQARGRSLEHSLRIGSVAAAEVISHFGARPEAGLKALVEKL